MHLDEHSDSRSSEQKVVSVSQLNRAVSQLLGSSFPMLWVEGEISNFTRAASGHCYFSLKDRSAQVRAVMFRSRARAASVQLRNGLQVQVLASVALYEARGDFQLSVENIRVAGAGDLHQQFVELKNRLQAEGLFDIETKRFLPAMPKTVGVVTSLKAAALRDVLSTLKKRAPHLNIIIYPTPVQGDEAPPRIVQALHTASRRAECDVLLLVRGGGAIEDLWAFNAESVARAIRASAIPVVVGVGHESDVTIADFAADLRAPTPTGAAATVAPETDQLLGQVQALTRVLAQSWKRRRQQLEQRIDTAWRVLPSPAGQLQAQRVRTEVAARDLMRGIKQLQQRRREQVNQAERRRRVPDTTLPRAQVAHHRHRLMQAVRRLIAAGEGRVITSEAQLGLVSPQAVLERGYSIVRDNEGRVLTSTDGIAARQSLDILMADGSVDATVESIRSRTDKG